MGKRRNTQAPAVPREAALQQILGDIRIIQVGDAIYAEFEPPAQRLLVAAAGGTVDVWLRG